MKEIKITVPDGMSAEWQEVDGRLILCCVDGDVPCVSADMEKKPVKDDRPVTERIKTFDDACDDLNRRSQAGDELANALMTDLQFNSPRTPDLLAFIQLRIITYALNEGWQPQFTEDEYRYFPWFILYTQSEIDAMDEAERSKLLRVGGRANAGAQCGLSYAYSTYGFSNSGTYFGARLAFKSSDLAVYAGNQFREIYSAFLFKPVEPK